MENDLGKMNDGLTEGQSTVWKLYLGGIPVSLDEADLYKLFEPYISKFKVTIMKHPEQGNSKGCGFLDVYTKADFKVMKKSQNRGSW